MSFRAGIRRFLLFFIFSVPLILVLGALSFWFALDVPYNPQPERTVEFTVARGDSFTAVSRRLEESGLVRSAAYVLWRYKIAERIGIEEDLQAGRYLLESGSRPSTIIRDLTNAAASKRVYTRVTIAPGLSSRSIAGRVEASGLSTAAYIQDAILSLAGDYPIKENPEGLQGYLFPETYNIETPLDNSPEALRFAADELVRQMADTFFEVLDELYPEWTLLTVNQLHEKVTLASIIEREYRVAEEAPKISAVFNNRLDDAMPLQSCATVAYTIENTEKGAPFLNQYLRQNRRIFLEYLEIEDEYNTYYHSGLPPGPIAIPGRVALEAAFFPADIDARYFVVKDPSAGTHTFTRDYGDHLAAREEYLNQYVVKE